MFICHFVIGAVAYNYCYWWRVAVCCRERAGVTEMSCWCRGAVACLSLTVRDDKTNEIGGVAAQCTRHVRASMHSPM